MIEDVQAIAVEEIVLGENVHLHLSLKTLQGKVYLDLRKWIKFPNQDEFVATRKGIMLSVEDWRRVIPQIMAYIERECQKLAA